MYQYVRHKPRMQIHRPCEQVATITEPFAHFFALLALSFCFSPCFCFCRMFMNMQPYGSNIGIGEDNCPVQWGEGDLPSVRINNQESAYGLQAISIYIGDRDAPRPRPGYFRFQYVRINVARPSGVQDIVWTSPLSGSTYFPGDRINSIGFTVGCTPGVSLEFLLYDYRLNYLTTLATTSVICGVTTISDSRTLQINWPWPRAYHSGYEGRGDSDRGREGRGGDRHRRADGEKERGTHEKRAVGCAVCVYVCPGNTGFVCVRVVF
jgi:NAD-dependent dihydropyrimidine dehydrogenase PreA subunit